MHDQTIPLNCPYCGRPVRFDRTEGETHLYVCQQCGALRCLQTDVCGGSSRCTR